MEIYLVGGAVRDRLLGQPVKDRDWCVVGATPQEMLDLGYKQVGADFPVFLHPETNEEYALARTERKSGKGYHGFTVDYNPTVTLEEDLIRRDLTINAMAVAEADVEEFLSIDVNDPAFRKTESYVIDPFNGLDDLRYGLLRHVSDAFAEDPLRILRVARFAARYKFTLQTDTEWLMSSMVADGEVDHLVPERSWIELEKAIVEPYAGKFFEVLDKVGALEHVYSFFNVATYPMVLDVIDDFTCEMETRHKLAAVLFLCLVHLNGTNLTHRRRILYTEARVPNDIQNLVESFMILAKKIKDKDVPVGLLKKLKDLGWYRNDVMVEELNLLLPPYMWAKDRYDLMVKAWGATCRIGYQDLTDEQKSTLKGAEIGEAIDELRLDKLRKLHFKETLRG